MSSYLLCLDASDCSKAALQRACKLVKPADSLCVLSVCTDAAKSGQCDEILAHARSCLLDCGNVCTLSFKKVEAEDPREAILAQARELDIDTIIMGNRGMSRLEGLILGSVSAFLVSSAPCSVLVVRNKH